MNLCLEERVRLESAQEVLQHAKVGVYVFVNVCVTERVRKLEKQEKIGKIYKHSELQILKLLPLQD